MHDEPSSGPRGDRRQRAHDATRVRADAAECSARSGQDEHEDTHRVQWGEHDRDVYDNPSARDLASMLPLDLTIDDYSTNEKIAYLPRKLSEQGSGPFDNERPGDLAYYAPWGNLAFLYEGYRYSSGLIRLGRIDGDFAPLRRRGKFDLRIELFP